MVLEIYVASAAVIDEVEIVAVIQATFPPYIFCLYVKPKEVIR